MRLSDYLREDLILHGLKAPNATAVLELFAETFHGTGHLESGETAFKALVAREESHTTCLGHGVAVPHATVEGLPKPLLLVATAQPPVTYGPPDAEPVDLFFVVLSPPGRESEHIKLLARICRLGQRPDGLGELRKAQDGAALLESLLRLDAQHV